MFAGESDVDWLLTVCCFVAFLGQKRVSENAEGKILQHPRTFLFHILCVENIYGT